MSDSDFWNSFKIEKNLDNKETSKSNTRKEQLDKEEFMSIYNDVKQNKVKIDDLSISDLIKMNILMKSEIELQEKQLDSNNELRLEIEQLEKENQELIKKLATTES